MKVAAARGLGMVPANSVCPIDKLLEFLAESAGKMGDGLTAAIGTAIAFLVCRPALRSFEPKDRLAFDVER